MTFPIASKLLDACVLSVISKEDTYGYDLTQKLGNTIELSESTLYPVLRRLLKDNLLETYDVAYDGRNRRYYKITTKGNELLQEYILAWQDHKNKIESLL